MRLRALGYEVSIWRSKVGRPSVAVTSMSSGLCLVAHVFPPRNTHPFGYRSHTYRDVDGIMRTLNVGPLLYASWWSGAS